ncbi:hypothetical protein [Listeria booriae]|uniref:hypothetical protein n=1 Tax=Listeria booriae TaxID=1552123 RepID=UPI00162655AA|nr:hypothetical protein [Listeria booriae]MBC1271433.1 hypothetical protein [Listeria booriae]MBC1293036.1 hypothetical protein [Listeria booriae]
MELLKLIVAILEFGFKVLTWLIERKTTMKNSEIGTRGTVPIPDETKMLLWIIMLLIMYILGQHWMQQSVTFNY